MVTTAELERRQDTAAGRLAIGEVALRVRDLDRVARYYRDAIGLEEVPAPAGQVGLGAGGLRLLTLNGAPADRTDTVDPTSVLLPNPYVAPYQALAARLRSSAAGTTIPAYIPLGGSVSVRVGESTTEQIQTLERLIQARRTMITVEAPGGQAAQALEIWSDEQGRLLRLSVPGQGVDALREAHAGRRHARPAVVPRDDGAAGAVRGDDR